MQYTWSFLCFYINFTFFNIYQIQYFNLIDILYEKISSSPSAFGKEETGGTAMLILCAK